MQCTRVHATYERVHVHRLCTASARRALQLHAVHMHMHYMHHVPNACALHAQARCGRSLAIFLALQALICQVLYLRRTPDPGTSHSPSFSPSPNPGPSPSLRCCSRAPGAAREMRTYDELPFLFYFRCCTRAPGGSRR